MFSVIIPFRGDINQLEQLLDSLTAQTTSREHEVIVADNSDPGSPVTALVEDLVARYERVRVVDATSKSGAAHARNVGAARARADRFAFVDADDVVDAGWLEAMAGALERHDVVASRFDLEVINPPDLLAGRKHPQSRGLIPFNEPPFLPHVGGCGLGVRREVFDEVGGFNEEYLVLEDTDFAWRVQLAGHSIWFERDALVHVRLRPTLRRSFAQSFRYGEAHARLHRDYRLLGLKPLGPRHSLLSLFSLLRSSYKLLSPERRSVYIRALGNRIGRWVGSLRYGVWAG